MRRTPLALLLLAAIFAAAAQADGPMNYQGRLDNNGQPFTGVVDMRFQFWTDAQGGLTIGPLIEVPAVQVTEGLFNARFDFDEDAVALDGSPWLEIQVGAQGSGQYASLDPRQPLDGSPYARQAAGAIKRDDGTVLITRDTGASTWINTLFETPPLAITPTATEGWQSFTAETDATLRSADVRLALVGAETLRIDIFEGEGTGGAFLGNDAIADYVVDQQSGVGFFRATNLDIPLAAGQLYTVAFFGRDASKNPATFRAPVADNLGYEFGQASVGAGSRNDNDFFARVNVESLSAPAVQAFEPGGQFLAPEILADQGDIDTLFAGALYVSNTLGLPSNSIKPEHIESEAGAAGYTPPNSVLFTKSLTMNAPDYEDVVTQAINRPASGYVMQLFSCVVRIDHVQGTQSRVVFFDFGSNGVQIPANAPTGTYRVPTTLHLPARFQNGAGVTSYTIEALASGAPTAAADLESIAYTILYFPTSYKSN